VRVDDSSYYAVQGGVWFTAGSPWGPWAVATYVPPVIYTIPTASPIHYVTYVRVYRYDPDYVWVGYTPGYLGTCYSPWGTVVYGTGWYYTPWIGTYWYGSPWTWGFGVGVSWSPWTGWDVGFGWGGYVYYDPWWGPYRSWHHRSHWHDHDRYDYDRHDHRRDDHGRDDRGRDSGGRGGHGTGDRGRDSGGRQRSTAINQMNVYNRPGVARSGVRAVTRPSAQPASDSRSGARPSAGQTGGTRPAPGQSSVQPGTRPAEPAGRPSSGQPTTVQPGGRPITGQPTTQPAQAGGRPAGTQPTRDVYAGPDGNVYRPRPSGGGWETSDRGGWTPVQPRSGSSDWSRGEVSRPSVGGRTIDSGTYNQLSRDYQGRQNGNMRMSPGPSGPSHGAPPAPRHR
jgi:hypothetical protein